MERDLTASVVIPCFNAAATVEGAVRSALEQTRPPAEVICVDDGSTDDTRRVLRRLEEAHPGRLQVVVQANAGACAARNRGLDRTAAAYVQFLDADDVLLPNKLEHQLALADRQGHPDIIAGTFTRVRVDGQRVVHVARPADPWVALPWVKLGVTSANLFSRRALARVGGWTEGLPSAQEYDLMFRMLQQGCTVAFDPAPLTVLQQRTESITLATPEANVVQRIGLVAEVLRHVRRTDGSAAAAEAAETALFCLIRMRCRLSLDRGVASFYEHFDDRYVPPRCPCVSRAYIALYRRLGFPRTQRLHHAVRRHLGRCRRAPRARPGTRHGDAGRGSPRPRLAMANSYPRD